MLVVVGALGAVAVPAYRGYRERVEIARGVAALAEMEGALQRWRTLNFRYPETLAEAGLGERRDPWGRPWFYLNIETARNRGAVRKDRNLVPINSDYDLYSAGRDGRTRPPLTARDSRDDLIRASNGGFFGIAEDY